jgi:hypothetical protein
MRWIRHSNTTSQIHLLCTAEVAGPPIIAVRACVRVLKDGTPSQAPTPPAARACEFYCVSAAESGPKMMNCLDLWSFRRKSAICACLSRRGRPTHECANPLVAACGQNISVTRAHTSYSYIRASYTNKPTCILRSEVRIVHIVRVCPQISRDDWRTFAQKARPLTTTWPASSS